MPVLRPQHSPIASAPEQRSAAASRLAPSPTGPLHLGNACTFLVNWALARKLGWQLHLRIEDLDEDRASADSAQEIAATLAWLGIDHDGPAVRQRDRLGLYQEAMRTLAAAGMVYESPHSRSEVREAAAALHAPHDERHAALGAQHASHPHQHTTRPPQSAGQPRASQAPTTTAFPRALRPSVGESWRFTDTALNHRFRVDPGTEAVHDQVAGAHSFDPARESGDFLVWTKGRVPAYQLAVVVDDAAQGVTDVVRGADLLPSAALQQLLYRALGHQPPRWWHLPLVLDAQGLRMAKRRGSSSLQALRAAGVDPARVVGLVAWWSGAQPRLEPISPETLRGLMDPSILQSWHARAKSAPPRADEEVLAWLHDS